MRSPRSSERGKLAEQSWFNIKATFFVLALKSSIGLAFLVNLSQASQDARKFNRVPVCNTVCLWSEETRQGMFLYDTFPSASLFALALKADARFKTSWWLKISRRLRRTEQSIFFDKLLVVELKGNSDWYGLFERKSIQSRATNVESGQDRPFRPGDGDSPFKR